MHCTGFAEGVATAVGGKRYLEAGAGGEPAGCRRHRGVLPGALTSQLFNG